MGIEQNQKRRSDPRVYADRFTESDYSIGRFDHKCEVGTTRETLLDPGYWSHVSERLTPYSKITVRCDDGTFYAELLVLDCGRGWAKLQVLNWWALSTIDVAQSQSSAGKREDYDILWKGNNKKHVVIRLSDQQVLYEGGQRKEVAELWLADFMAGKAHRTVPIDETQPG